MAVGDLLGENVNRVGALDGWDDAVLEGSSVASKAGAMVGLSVGDVVNGIVGD